MSVIFKVTILLVITGQPQTLDRNIAGTQGQILTRFLLVSLHQFYYMLKLQN